MTHNEQPQLILTQDLPLHHNVWRQTPRNYRLYSIIYNSLCTHTEQVELSTITTSYLRRGHNSYPVSNVFANTKIDSQFSLPQLILRS